MQTPISLYRFTVMGVALISAIVTPVIRYTLWGFVVGIIFLLVLYAYGQLPKDAPVSERVAYSGTQAVCVALALSWLPHFVSPMLTNLSIVIGGSILSLGSQDLWYFLLWLVVFVAGYVMGRRW